MKSYNLPLDIKRITTLYDISLENFSREIGLSRTQLYNLLNEKDNPSKQTLEKIYSYPYNHDFDFNKNKASFYIDEARNKKVLFHGCKKEIIGEVDIYHSEPPNDFGDGFYLGESLTQAATWVSGHNDANVYCFYFSNNNLKRLDFVVDRRWLYAIMYFRGAFIDYAPSEEVLDIINDINNTDYIVAPIADNEMFKTIDEFIRNEITDEACLHALSATHLGLQYVFKSVKACKKLEFVDRFYLCNVEKNNYLNIKNEMSKEGIDKARLAKVEYRRKGKYFDEIFKRKR